MNQVSFNFRVKSKHVIITSGSMKTNTILFSLTGFPSAMLTNSLTRIRFKPVRFEGFFCNSKYKFYMSFFV